MALTKIKAAALTADLIDETKLADNSLDSEHYNDGSIDSVHIGDDQVRMLRRLELQEVKSYMVIPLVILQHLL